MDLAILIFVFTALAAFFVGEGRKWARNTRLWRSA
jgi:hypothetical protein